MATKKKKAQAVEAADAHNPEATITENAVPQDAEPVPEPVPTPKPKTKKRAKEGATLETVFAGYLDALEKEGKSDGTISSYRMELQLAGADLGLDTKVADLTPDRIVLFVASDRVQKTRSGRAKSPLSIAKTERVLRQALVWAEGAGLVAKAPLPENAATH